MQPREAEEQLYLTLDRLVKRMTHRVFGTPREMQMDVGSAIRLAYDTELPQKEYLISTLSKLLRELGNRRPDVHRYVISLEETVNLLDRRRRGGGPQDGLPPGL